MTCEQLHRFLAATVLGGALVVFSATVAWSGQLAPGNGAATGGPPSARAVHVKEGPTLDGDVLGDAVWAQVPPTSGFWQE